MDLDGLEEDKMVWQYVATFIFVLAIFNHIEWFDNTSNFCDENDYSTECLEYAIEESPPIKELTNLVESCDNSVEECLFELGKIKLLKKVEQKVEKMEE